MAFCLQCGQPATYQIPEGDSRERIVCSACGYIHYENPKIICGVLAIHEDKILLCKRAIEPRYGYWTLPAGFMEIGETMANGAIREMLEEADGVAQSPKLYALFDIPSLGQVHVMYLAVLKDGAFGVGAESLECRLFAIDDIDFDNLAFRTIDRTLRFYINDKQKLMEAGQDFTDFNLFPLHQECLMDAKK